MWSKNYDSILSHFHPIPERYGQTDGRTDRQTDRRTDRIAISISRVSVLTSDKNGSHVDTVPRVTISPEKANRISRNVAIIFVKYLID